MATFSATVNQPPDEVLPAVRWFAAQQGYVLSEPESESGVLVFKKGVSSFSSGSTLTVTLSATPPFNTTLTFTTSETFESNDRARGTRASTTRFLLGLGATTVALSLGALALATSSASVGPSASQKAAVVGVLGNARTSSPVASPAQTTTTASATTTVPPTTHAAPTNSSTDWLLSVSASSDLNAVACPSTSTCFVAGGTSTGVVLGTATGGQEWNSFALPAGTPALNAIACPSASECVAVGKTGAILTTTTGGASWSLQDIPMVTSLNGVSCADGSACVAVGNEPSTACHDESFYVSSFDAGSTWSPPDLISNCSVMNGIVCPTDQVCYAVGYHEEGTETAGEIFGTVNAGESWNGQFILHGTPNGLDDVTCPSTSECFAVGNADLRAVLYTADSGGTWAAQNDADRPTGARIWQGVSCWSWTGCVAVGQASPLLLLSTVSGHWKPLSIPATVGALTSVACPGPSDCVAVGEAVGGGGVVVTFSGASRP